MCSYHLSVFIAHLNTLALCIAVQRTEQSRKSRQAEMTMKDRLDDAHGTISLEKSSKREISVGKFGCLDVTVH